MKKLLLFTLAACLSFGVAMAQNPANFHLYYGSTDGSVVSVGLDRDIAFGVWGSTSSDPGELHDSVTFMHNPLASDDLIITARTGGTFTPPVSLWDDVSFLTPDLNTPAGFTSQSMLGFAYLTDPRSPENFFWTNGAIVQIGTFSIHTTADYAYIDQTVCPFVEGSNPANGSTTWGMEDGMRGVNPTKHFACIYFSPNSPPVNNTPASVTVGLGDIIHLFGTDPDPDDILAVVQTSGDPVALTMVVNTGGVFDYTFPAPLVVGTYVFCFEVSDGANDPVPFCIEVIVSCGELTDASLLYISCAENGFPGTVVPLELGINNDGCVGGFELLIQYDPTALTLVGVAPTARIYGGSEYFNHVPNAEGPGTDRFVWIANVNNGVYGPPMGGPGTGGIVTLNFLIDSSLPFDMMLPVAFLYTGDFTDNTISDETGYDFITPQHEDGCIWTTNPDELKGDPNMNCLFYEVADVVLVARRLISGNSVWLEDNSFPASPDCPDMHDVLFDAAQEAAGDLNNNGFVDVADLVRFINILNGFITPKLDVIGGSAVIVANNGAVSIRSESEVGAALVRMNGNLSDIQVAPGMDYLVDASNGVTSVLIYSMSGQRIPAGNAVLFTYSGEGQISEASASDALGQLLEVSAFAEAPLPTAYGVSQNYPNPFNAKTIINFALPTESDVNINIYNVTGQLVETINGHYAAGYQSVTWDATGVASGIYFYKLAAGQFSQTMKMTLLK